MVLGKNGIEDCTAGWIKDATLEQSVPGETGKGRIAAILIVCSRRHTLQSLCEPHIRTVEVVDWIIMIIGAGQYRWWPTFQLESVGYDMKLTVAAASSVSPDAKLLPFSQFYTILKVYKLLQSLYKRLHTPLKIRILRFLILVLHRQSRHSWIESSLN